MIDDDPIATFFFAKVEQKVAGAFLYWQTCRS
jgi:hypothetical protein